MKILTQCGSGDGRVADNKFKRAGSVKITVKDGKGTNITRNFKDCR